MAFELKSNIAIIHRALFGNHPSMQLALVKRKTSRPKEKMRRYCLSKYSNKVCTPLMHVSRVMEDYKKAQIYNL